MVVAGEEVETALPATNYTSGTTGAPKDVIHHYSGAYAYLQALARASSSPLRSRAIWPVLTRAPIAGQLRTFDTTAPGRN
ncbi:hypothetical protein E3G68_005078 [Mycobacteroides abscessus]|uniref:hypothetical protein n=1 Tax=Mycobacteroides abscessus TaxID=36809 RepID=UPI00187835E4|nr:hypothetical protein [Mycobacteroides abscessus]